MVEVKGARRDVYLVQAAGTLWIRAEIEREISMFCGEILETAKIVNHL